MRRQMYVSKEFYDVVSLLSALKGKNRIEITKEIAEKIKEDLLKKELDLFR